jgi:hypothetical protein
LKDQAANKLLERLPGWRRAYSDDVSIIFVRTISALGTPVQHQLQVCASVRREGPFPGLPPVDLSRLATDMSQVVT